VADVGAGTGLFTRLFARATGNEGRVIAVDIAPKFIEHIQKSCREEGLANVETRLCTADSTELDEASVDLAFICDTYHHFEFPQKTMASLRRALKPGGRVIIVDFRRIPGQSTEWVLNHVRAGQEVFESEVAEAGFRKTREANDLLKENYLVEFSKSALGGLRPLAFPVIEGYGGVVVLPQAAEKPRQGAKVVFDVTTDSAPDAVNKGLERVARLLNLYGAAGMQATDVQVAVVLHGHATRAALADDFYAPRFGAERNPNLPLVRALRKAMVEIFVCGQALDARGFPESAVLPEVTVADAALTVIVNRQIDGFRLVEAP
jgi:SAM-dependent methyltransferase